MCGPQVGHMGRMHGFAGVQLACWAVLGRPMVLKHDREGLDVLAGL